MPSEAPLAALTSASGGGGAMILAMVLAPLLLCCCCLLAFCWRRRQNRRRAREEAVRKFDTLLPRALSVADVEPDQTNGEASERRILAMAQVQKALSLSEAEGKPIDEAAEEVIRTESVLPPMVAAALAKEFERRHGIRGAPEASEGEKLALLSQLLAPPAAAAVPTDLAAHAHALFARLHGRPAPTDAEALLILSDLLGPHLERGAAGAAALEGAIEEAAPLEGGARGGGGVRLRPPSLAAYHDGASPLRKFAPDLPPPTADFDPSSLPFAVLEASTAMFGHVAASLMGGDERGALLEQMHSLRQQLDAAIDQRRSGAMSEAAALADGDGGAQSLADGGGAQPSLELPREILSAAAELFASRHGQPASEELETLVLLRDVLAEAGFAGQHDLSRRDRAIAALPPPPPSCIEVSALPDSIKWMAATVHLASGEGRGPMPADMLAQAQVQRLRKVLDDDAADKTPQLVLSMARAEYERGAGFSAACDLEAVEALLATLSHAGVGDVRQGWHGGGGTKVRAPFLSPPQEAGAARQPPPPPFVDLERVPSMCMRAAMVLAPAKAAASDEQGQVALVRARLQEYAKAALPVAVLTEAHKEYRTQHGGRAAASDREALDALAGVLEAATVSDVREGWHGGGGARIFPPRPKPPPAPEGGGGYAGSAITDRPLDLGVVPLAVFDAVASANRGRRSSHRASHRASQQQQQQRRPAGHRASPEAAKRMAPQLQNLLGVLDGALGPRGEQRNPFGGGGGGLEMVPLPVLDACSAVFVSRHGHAPPDPREAMELVRTMLLDTGLRTLEGARGHALTEAAPSPLPDDLMHAAMELDGDADGLGSGGAPTPQQLFQLQAQIDACLADHDSHAASSALHVPSLPDDLQLALQAEFHTRVGDGAESANPRELLQLAKQLVSEADDASAAVRERFLTRHSSRHSSAGGGRRSLFGAAGGDPSLSLDERLMKTASPASSFGFGGVGAGAEAVGGASREMRTSMVGGFGFVHERHSDNDGQKEHRRRSLAAARPAHDEEGEKRGGRKRFSLVERADSAEWTHKPAAATRPAGLTLQHLGSRKRALDSSVREAIGALQVEPALRDRVVDRAVRLDQPPSGRERGVSSDSGPPSPTRPTLHARISTQRLRRMVGCAPPTVAIHPITATATTEGEATTAGGRAGTPRAAGGAAGPVPGAGPHIVQNGHAASQPSHASPPRHVTFPAPLPTNTPDADLPLEHATPARHAPPLTSARDASAEASSPSAYGTAPPVPAGPLPNRASSSLVSRPSRSAPVLPPSKSAARIAALSAAAPAP